MGVQYDDARRKYVVRWRQDGRQRKRRFTTQTQKVSVRFFRRITVLQYSLVRLI